MRATLVELCCQTPRRKIAAIIVTSEWSYVHSGISIDAIVASLSPDLCATTRPELNAAMLSGVMLESRYRLDIAKPDASCALFDHRDELADNKSPPINSLWPVCVERDRP